MTGLSGFKSKFPSGNTIESLDEKATFGAYTVSDIKRLPTKKAEETINTPEQEKQHHDPFAHIQSLLH